VPVHVAATGLDRYPQAAAAAAAVAVYFCCLEALQNVSKYAKASAVEISIATDDGQLRFRVTDDGVGYDAERTPLGSGLRNMADRLSALGGRLDPFDARPRDDRHRRASALIRATELEPAHTDPPAGVQAAPA
jgi:signal transduction histidine kinase